MVGISWRVRAVVATVVVALAAAMVARVAPAAGVTTGGRPGGPGQAPAAASAATERSASAQARATGRRVEVLAERSETGQVFANPDGSVTMQESVVPLRVRRGTGWVPVDATLQARADGTVAPRALPLSLAFSGGGSAPLVRLGAGGKQLVLRWPAALPRPVLAGDSATYREVLPGVDLRLRALPRGFSEVLVVKDRAAAANPELAAVRFGLSATRLSVRTDEAGNLGAYDRAGKLVFGSGAALMWDSTREEPAAPGARALPGRTRPAGEGSPAASADAPGTASRRAVGKLGVDRHGVGGSLGRGGAATSGSGFSAGLSVKGSTADIAHLGGGETTVNVGRGQVGISDDGSIAVGGEVRGVSVGGGGSAAVGRSSSVSGYFFTWESVVRPSPSPAMGSLVDLLAGLF